MIKILTNKVLENLETLELVNLYASAALENHKLSLKNSRTANKVYDYKVNIYREIKARGIKAQIAMLALLNSKEPVVRCAAASWILEFSSKEASNVLEELAAGKDAISFTAQTVLKVWRDGKLNFP